MNDDYKLYSQFDLENIDDLVWQISDHFHKNAAVTIYGKTNIDNTYISLDMAMSIANGVPFLNKWKTKKGNVLYIYTEDGSVLKRKVRSWTNSRGLGLCSNIIFSNTAHDFEDRSEVQRLINRAKSRLSTIDAIFVDNITTYFPLNKVNDIRAYLDSVDFIREETGATVVSVDRRVTSVPKRLSEYSDTLIHVYPDTITGLYCLYCQKQRDAANFEPYLYKPVISVPTRN